MFTFGFVGLCALWALGPWRDDGRGLFTYRAASLGDALLLPLAAGILAAGVRRLGEWGSEHDAAPVRERLWTGTAAAVGAAAGAALQWWWWHDDDPQRNWTLPEPHDFNTPGLYHAAFLTIASALFVALLVALLRRARAVRRVAGASGELSCRLDGLLASSGTALLVLCLVGFGVLVVQDAAGGADETSAGRATLVAVAAGSGMVLAAGTWALGLCRLLRARRAMALGLLGAGALALGTHPWPPHGAALQGGAVVLVVLVGAAVTEPLRARSHPRAAAIFAVSTVVLWTGLARAIEALPGGGEDSFWWLAGACAIAAVIPTVAVGERKLWREVLGTGLVSFYPLMALLLAARLLYEDDTHAAASVNVADTAFDVMVFALFRERFRRLVLREDAGVKEEEEGRTETEDEQRDRARGDSILRQLAFLGLAVIGSLFVLLAVATVPLGFDDEAAQGSPSTRDLVAGGACLLAACAIAAIARALAARDARRVPVAWEAEELQIARRPIAVLILAAAVWACWPWVIAGDTRSSVAAAVAAIVAGALAAESVCSVTYINVVALRARVVVAGVAVGAAVASTTYWALADALWADGAPTETWRFAIAVVGVLLGNAALTMLAGWVAAQGRPKAPRDTVRHFARETSEYNATQDALLYAVLVLIAAVVPLYAVSRLDVTAADDIVVIAAFVFLPGLIGAALWVFDNNLDHLDRETTYERPPRAVRERGGWDRFTAWDLEHARRKALKWHINAQNVVARGLLYVGVIGFLGAHLLDLG